MSKTSQRKGQFERDMVDAIREMMGLDPLYAAKHEGRSLQCNFAATQAAALSGLKLSSSSRTGGH